MGDYVYKSPEVIELSILSSAPLQMAMILIAVFKDINEPHLVSKQIL